MAGIVDLQRLVRCTERFYRSGGALSWQCRGEESFGPPDFLPDPDEWERTCRACFHRAVYRVLLSGSILAGWHMEPFASEGVPNQLPPDFPASLRLLLANQPTNNSDVPWDETADFETLAYLERFIPFDQDANTRVTEKQDAVFGSLGSGLPSLCRKHLSCRP